MSLRIRLQRVGKKNRPMFRIVVIERRQAAKGKPVDIIGIYDPVKKTGKLDFEKYERWVKNGAEPSDTMKSLYKRFLKNKEKVNEIISAISTPALSNESNEEGGTNK